ncbi:MAG: AbiH family protein [Oscillospiraceae bacterium]
MVSDGPLSFKIKRGGGRKGFIMADLNQENKAPVLTARELLCDACGKTFIFSGSEQTQFAQRGWALPKRCPVCRKEKRDLQMREKQQIERLKWQRDKVVEKEQFNVQLENWKVVAKEDIHPGNNQVLYIIGNGFDLMHGVHSSYYAFRDFLGKRNVLRQTLEDFLTVEDIWVDFEEALAHFEMEAMCSESLVDDWLDIFDAYDEDSCVANYFLAAEAAAGPILTVAAELPRQFRRWVETLSIGTDDRPLKNIFRNGKVLCFNYTEFVETLYGVAKNNVCYIHGCRRKEKYHQKETLILGHTPGASDEAYDFDHNSSAGTKDPYKRYMIEASQENVFRLIAEGDQALTKNCSDIIADHEAFFSGLNEVEDIIVVGHALGRVDWDYFSQVASRTSARKKARWYFGCHGLRDLEHLEQLLTVLEIERSSVFVFRTDDISVTSLKNREIVPPHKSVDNGKFWCTSDDGKWAVKTLGCSLLIVNVEKRETDYETMLPPYIGDVFFAPSQKTLFIITHGEHSGVFFFSLTEDHWSFTGELESAQYQRVISVSLSRVFLTDQEVTFVYNNRVRKYALIDGATISNRAVRKAPSFFYDGEEVTGLFLRGKR